MTSSISVERSEPTPLAKVTRAALVWFLVALVFVFQNGVVNAVRGDPFQWLPVVWFELEYWIVFFLATPVFLWSVRRFRFEPGTVVRSLAAHTGIGIAFAALQPVLADGLNYLTLRAVAAPSDPRVAHIVESSLHTYSYFMVTAPWKYAVVIGCCSSFYYYQRSRDLQIRAIRLEGVNRIAVARRCRAVRHFGSASFPHVSRALRNTMRRTVANSSHSGLVAELLGASASSSRKRFDRRRFEEIDRARSSLMTG